MKKQNLKVIRNSNSARKLYSAFPTQRNYSQCM